LLARRLSLRNALFWPIGHRPANTCILPSFLRNALEAAQQYPTQKRIAKSDNTFGGLDNFLSANPLDVKNVIAEYSVMENWEKVQSGK
jgi:hypothetical protein